ncbi:MAG: DUF2384 domain-containing protein [Betaproteobacteria bacterium]|nr:DUF2384 domain-containing protein [Betaproteobacteria bacterium]
MSEGVETVLNLLAIPAPRRRRIHSIMDLESLVQEGLPGRALIALQTALEIPVARFVEIVGISARSFSNLGKNRNLDLVVSDRLARIARIAAKCEEVFGSREKAVHWLHEPLIALGGKTPFERMLTETGAARVEDILVSIEHGVYV